MEKNKNISSEALEGVENLKSEHEGDDDDDEDDNKFVEGNEQMQLSGLLSPIITTDSKVPQLETLAVPENDIQSGFITSSHRLSEVPVEYTLQPHESSELKSQVRVSQQQALVSVMTQTDQAHLLNHLQLPGCQTSSLELSPTSVTQSILSVPSPTLQEQRILPPGNSNGMCVADVNQKNSSDSKTVSAAPIVKASSVDGFANYNWRKYGQKQVKSPQGFRSYYKCTYFECYAKKIECYDSSSSVIEIIYKSRHNHDPPLKINCAREKSFALSVAPIMGSTNTSNQARTLSSKDPATSSGESIEKKIPITETKQQISSGSDGNAQMNDVEEHVDEPEPKRRVKKSSSVYNDPVCTSGKKPKFVVHAAGDVGISGDGYRWRKYGQKVVKGTPHPRNYYRCTSVGCPVRKHTEMSTDNMSALIITYKGVHDHDMPVPKKRPGPPSAPLLAAAAPTSMNNLKIKKPEVLQNEQSATQWSVDKEGELIGETLSRRGERAMDSARTLLSIGFEIKPC